MYIYNSIVAKVSNWKVAKSIKLVSLNMNKRWLRLIRCRSCDAVDHLYAQICAPDEVNNMNVKVVSSMSKLSETRFLVHH